MLQLDTTHFPPGVSEISLHFLDLYFLPFSKNICGYFFRVYPETEVAGV
jgi:hypothetical protein